MALAPRRREAVELTQANKYTVAPFSGKGYQRNAERCDEHEPCAICGRPVKNPKHQAIVIDGGAAWGDENSDQRDSGYMGTYTIGNDCHNKYLAR